MIPVNAYGSAVALVQRGTKVTLPIRRRCSQSAGLLLAWQLLSCGTSIRFRFQKQTPSKLSDDVIIECSGHLPCSLSSSTGIQLKAVCL